MSKDRQGYARTQVYIGDRKAEPKHMFVRIADTIAERAFAQPRLLDVGGASGAFAEYALLRFPGSAIRVVDFDPVLVAEARKLVPGVAFEVGDANRLDTIASQAHDAVTLTGTHSIFDDFRPSFSECIRVCAEGGRIIVTGIFNPYPVDAQIHWRYAERFEDAWHPGYNLFSHQSVSAFLKTQPRVAGFEFRPFRLPFDLAPQQDPIRSWTELQPDGQREFRNGIMQLNFEMLVIDLHRP